jgi:membrane fusion protein, multidrug efflux system
MKTAGEHHSTTRGKLLALAILVIGVAAAVYAAHRSATHPTTDDATIDADVVHVAAAVGGHIIQIAVAENSLVSKGDLLFQIDPLPYRRAVAQAEAIWNSRAGSSTPADIDNKTASTSHQILSISD